MTHTQRHAPKHGAHPERKRRTCCQQRKEAMQLCSNRVRRRAQFHTAKTSPATVCVRPTSQAVLDDEDSPLCEYNDPCASPGFKGLHACNQSVHMAAVQPYKAEPSALLCYTTCYGEPHLCRLRTHQFPLFLRGRNSRGPFQGT